MNKKINPKAFNSHTSNLITDKKNKKIKRKDIEYIITTLKYLFKERKKIYIFIHVGLK